MRRPIDAEPDMPETPAQEVETHYEILRPMGNSLTFGPFEKGDIIAESKLGPEIVRLVRIGAIKPATREVAYVPAAAPAAPAPGLQVNQNSTVVPTTPDNSPKKTDDPQLPKDPPPPPPA